MTFDSVSKVGNEDRQIADEHPQLVAHGGNVAIPVLRSRCLQRAGHEGVALDETVESISQVLIWTRVRFEPLLAFRAHGPKLVGTCLHRF